jgi:hypothetical protein
MKIINIIIILILLFAYIKCQTCTIDSYFKILGKIHEVETQFSQQDVNLSLDDMKLKFKEISDLVDPCMGFLNTFVTGSAPKNYTFITDKVKKKKNYFLKNLIKKKKNSAFTVLNHQNG